LSDQRGNRGSLQVDEDGWLSAGKTCSSPLSEASRRLHVCFHVEPAHRENASHQTVRRSAARFVSASTALLRQGIEQGLRKAALARANALKCQRMHGFDLNGQVVLIHDAARGGRSSN
jgi:hypothetical protein